MDSQKIENLLNLAMEATEEEREKSGELEVGFNQLEETWDIIVKYHGDLLQVLGEGIQAELLMGNYAILTVPESRLNSISQLSEVEYIEKPKRLYFALNQGKRASCIPEVQVESPYLKGEGVIVGIIDSGIDYFHNDFRKEDGSTRILALWDQTVAPDPEKGWNPPQGSYLGTEFTKEKINQALEEKTRAAAYEIVPSRDLSGHGTAVAGIAAGNGRESRGTYRGVAPESSLLVVKLGNPGPNSFPKTTELMRALNYVIKKALELEMPVSINLSFGNTYGSHTGTSLIETYINNISNIWKNVICIGSGNEGAAGGHVGGKLTRRRDVELVVSPYEDAFSVQIWKNYTDEIGIMVIAPNGEELAITKNISLPFRASLLGVELLIYYGEPSPYSGDQEIYIDFLPKDQYITSGIWKIRLEPVQIVEGSYRLYLPSENSLQTGTRFLLPTSDMSFTIPSTAANAITVGAYNSLYESYADFSGRGYVGMEGMSKPDLVAPGVNIMSTKSQGRYESVTGTSFATPFVTGGAALLMEWGIVRGNDPFLYGEKVKAYLRKGARPLPGFTEYPNPQVGYGAMCLASSLPT